jgi:DNA-binding beta-propeller fold protein YncE
MKSVLSSENRYFLIKISIIFTITMSLISFITSCAPVEKRKEVELYWPLPPEKPRIKWIRWVRGEADVKKRTSGQKILSAVLGEEEQNIWLIKPYGVHASQGRIFVADTAIGKVVVFDTIKKDYFILGESGPGILSKPSGVTTDSEGNIYVTDTVQDRAVVYKRDGEFSHALGQKGQFAQPAGIAVNNILRRVYVVDVRKHQIQVFNKDNGKFLFSFGQRGKGDGEFNFPTNIFIDHQGIVYVCDSMNFRVQIFNEEGEFIFKFGKVGDVPGMFARPKGIAADSEGHIYVSDAAFNNIQIFDRKGRLLLVFGSMGKGPGMFWLPAGMYIDENDMIYVADQYNSRINIFQYLTENIDKSK